MDTELVRAAIRGQYEPPEPKSAEELVAEEFLKPKPVLRSKWTDVFQPHMQLDVAELSSQVATFPTYDPRIRVHFSRTGLAGKISGLKLVAGLPTQEGAMAMTRKMAAKKNNVRGKSGQIPFTPGGIDISEQSSAVEMHRNESGLLDIAPGLSRTMKAGSAGGSSPDMSASDLITQEDYDNGVEESEIEDTASISESISSAVSDPSSNVESTGLAASKISSIDELLPASSNFMRHASSIAENSRSAIRNWAHMVDINQNMPNFKELVPNPARTWPFELDNFQKEAIFHLEQGDCVFVAAHTSAGKTVVAEYAMSMAVQHMTKCIYTSPIKALSNQKYRDFKQEYDDVGILTGDVQLNADASTLIMTTEILRSMLYRGADIIRDVEFIIFDEVHYVNDSERGVVWEEVIIMLPDHVKLILLSATVPNTFEFANWVGRTKQKDVYVISTPKRPVPLMHNLWVKKNLLQVVDPNRQFVEKNYKLAQDLLTVKKDVPKASGTGGRGGRGGSKAGAGGSRGGASGSRGGRGGSRGAVSSGQNALNKQLGPAQKRFNSSPSSKNELLDLVEFLRSKNLLPAVVFVFSRKMCEQYAENMQSVQLNNAKEKSQVYMFMDKAVSRLRKEDRELPQIQMLRQLLQQGIGVHHSGLLPIMKEVVEILFAKGLVKLLFATETFAMGLNLPTRTVVFSAVRKFDSKTMRFLSPGEYTQMAGRAGRRGLDDVGTVIIMNSSKDQLIPRGPLEQMTLGTPLKLSSQFRLTYNMILSLLRIEALKVEDVIQQSFSENAQFTLRPEREQKLMTLDNLNKSNASKLEALVSKLNIEDSSVAVCRDFVENMVEFRNYTYDIYKNAVQMMPYKYKQHFCLLRDPKTLKLEVGWIRGITSKDNKKENIKLNVFALGSVTSGLSSVPCISSILPASTRKFNIDYFQTRRNKYQEYDLEQVEFISKLSCKDFEETSNKISSNISDFFEEASFNNFKSVWMRSTLSKRDSLQKQMEPVSQELKSVADKSKNFSDLILQTITNVEGEMEAEKIRTSAALSNTALLPDYEQRINVLKAANYLDEGLNVALKGRVACEISTGYELYLTELIMDNFLGSYEPEEIVALLSAFVFDGARGAEDPITVTPRLDEGKSRLLELVDYVQKLAIKNQVTLTQDEAEFAEKDRFALMQVVYEWARGMTFSEITRLTTVQEGLIVRVINRLDEICRSVMNAARIIGEVSLYDKLAIAQERIRRDIVFCSSLYL